MKGEIKVEIEKLKASSPALQTASTKVESDTGRRRFLYDFYRYWRWLRSEGVKRFPWLSDITSPDELISHFDNFPSNSKERYFHLDLIEAWLRSPENAKVSSNTKRTLLASIRGFYLKNRSQIPKEKVAFDKSELEVQRIQNQTPLELSQLRSIIMRGNILERAVLLCCFQGAMGVGEFMEFNKYTEDLAKQVEKGEVPLQIKLHRPKTDEVYYSFLHKDGVEALKLWLEERQRLTGEPIKIGEPVFVSRDKKLSTKPGSARSKKRGIKDVFVPVQTWTIQRIIRTLSREVGIETAQKADGNSPGSIRYKVHPHELRDTFKSVCSIVSVSPIMSEFVLGHSIDKLGYDKSPWFDEGFEFFKSEYNKLAPYLNLISTAGSPVQMKEQTNRILMLEDRIRELEDVLREFERENGFYAGHKFDQMMEPNLTNGTGTYEIRSAKSEEELDDLLAQGFEVIVTMPNGSWKLRRKVIKPS